MIGEAAARKAVTDRWGEVEEAKRLLLSNGAAVYDVEVNDADGEFNVYVDATAGAIMLVNIEYRQIGRPGVENVD